MLFLILFFIALIILILLGPYFARIILAHPRYIQGHVLDQNIDPTKPHILLVCVTNILGGAEMHTVGLYRKLCGKGYHVVILAAGSSKFDQYLTEKNISHYTTHAYDFRKSFLRPLYHVVLRRSLRIICKKEQIASITCNCTPEVSDARAIKKELAVQVVFTRQCVKLPSTKYIHTIDALLAVNKEVATCLQNKNQQENLRIGTVLYVPVMFDETPHLSYQPTENKEIFFKKNFGITIENCPVITKIANFYENLAHKNHPLLFEAIHILIHEKKKEVHVMLAGYGIRQSYLEELTKKLGINQYVHFLGFTQNIPGLLYHSDALVHTSGFEAFGIVYLEAGLMHKSAIGAYQTAAEHIIIHEKTGLLFKNNDAYDLVTQIERLIDDKDFARQLGNHAFAHVMQNLSPEVTFKQYEKIYQKAQNPRPTYF